MVFISFDRLDGNNNPVWGTQTMIATASTGALDPQNRNIEPFKTTAISSGNIVICFDDYIGNNYHLGGIKVGRHQVLWRASPSVAYFNGKGGYEISNGVNYAGSDVQAFDRHVVFGYHGEFFRSQGQAGQHLHFYDDGLFHRPVWRVSHRLSAGYAVPGFVGNGFGPLMVRTNGEYYCYRE